ncbi:MAG: diacylglycerol kinase family lipid kinase [Chitinophagales bacterium]
MQKKKILFIINPIAGINKKKKIPKLAHQLTDSNKYEVHIAYTQYAGHAKLLAKKAVNDAFDVVVAVGGDGSINEVAQQLIHTEVALGIVPGGSGNGFARKLRIPRNRKKALEVLNEAHTIQCDVGIINNKVFFSNAGVGIEALIVNRFATTKVRGFVPYARWALHSYATYSPQKYTIFCDDMRFESEALFLNFSNSGQYGYQIGVAPEVSDMTDGLLEMIVVKPFPKWRALYLLPMFMMGKASSVSYVDVIQTDKAVIQCEVLTDAQIDGDPAGKATDFEVKVLKGALKVIVPTI